MAAKDDGESAREEEDQRIVDLALQADYKTTGKGQWSFGKGSELERKSAPRWQRRQRWQRWVEEPMAEGQWQEKEANGKRKVAKEKPERFGRVARQGKLQRGVEKEATNICTPLMRMTVKTFKKHLTMMKMMMTRLQQSTAAQGESADKRNTNEFQKRPS